MDNEDSGSYRLAVSPQLPDDGLTSEGRPRAIRYKKKILNEINQELQLEEHKLNVEEICEIYQTDPEFGLMATQAKAILERDDLNEIEVENEQSKLSVADSIKKLRAAGLKVVIVTGDHPTTAKSVARMTNIISQGNETIEEMARRLALPIQQIDPSLAQITVVHGSDTQKFTPEALDAITSSSQELVFARLTPQQKLLVVESFQRNESIVTVVGDGLNDLPMMKKSDLDVLKLA
ncbi:hypothetical protein RND71_043629 [Anisodus tanguticus]|uniref:Uncharacterized protein n=1 Tax=Anisodus tanguticus TaxID=243964 RepID=A0AAE1ULW2_9SOLA|nr:hypothetical protein RND71_043629 [Anisodus tanguticus]